MDIEVCNRPSFAHLRAKLAPGEVIIAESGSMASMTSNTNLRATWNGGFFTAIIRKLFGGESLFVNEVSSTSGTAEVMLTQATPGDMVAIKLNGTEMFLESGSFVACTPGVTLSVGFAGFASIFGGEGFFRLKVGGNGTVWIGGYGAIVERELTSELTIDSGHLIAYETTVSLTGGLAGGLVSSFLSKEGVVMRARGPGRVYLQTRSLDGLATWTNRFLF
jgi:uncharacterized protein (TIGR00266 family)